MPPPPTAATATAAALAHSTTELRATLRLTADELSEMREALRQAGIPGYVAEVHKQMASNYIDSPAREISVSTAEKRALGGCIVESIYSIVLHEARVLLRKLKSGTVVD